MRSLLGVLGLVLCALPLLGCNEPERTFPVLKPREQPPFNPVNQRPDHAGVTYSGMTYSGMTYSGMTYSGMTYSGMTYSGMTYSGLTSSGLTASGDGIRLPSAGITLPSSGVTMAQGEVAGAGETGILLPWAKPEPKQLKAATVVEVELQPVDHAELLDFIAQTKAVTVLDVWSTSCPPCMAEFHNLVQLQKRYGDEIVCASLNIDYIGLKKKSPESYMPAALEFLTEQEATIPNFLSTLADEDMREELNISSIPAILIFDADGKLAHKVTVDNSGDELTYLGDVVPKVKELLGSTK